MIGRQVSAIYRQGTRLFRWFAVGKRVDTTGPPEEQLALLAAHEAVT